MKADVATADRTQTFLFLQGPSSPLFARIADNLERLGHRCLRVNLCAGDWVFWRRPGAINYRGHLEDWPGFVARLMEDEGITGLVLLGEERPHHLAATMAAKARGITTYAVEMGYLRPDWIRVEKGGSGYNSHFPADPDTIMKAAEALPEPDFTQHYAHTFRNEALYDLLFNLPNVFLKPLYPHYRWHAIYHPLAEYAGWVKRFFKGHRLQRRSEALVRKILTGHDPYFLFPLQLETDYQIRAYSTFRSQREAIKLVIESFAANAAPNARLLFKVHPLDNALIDWEREIGEHAAHNAVAERVHFIEGGNFTRIATPAAGIITINSTAGLVGLQRMRPVKTLGISVYDIPGLTDSGPLDGFWTEPAPPQPALVHAFIRLLAATVHVRGDFYSDAGVEAGAAAIAQRLHDGSVNEPGGFVAEPQRARPTILRA